MHTVLKIFSFLGWGAIFLFSSFLIGLGLGTALCWRLRKPIPVKYQEVVDTLNSLELELGRTEETFEKLWAKRFSLDSRKPPVDAISTIDRGDPASEPVNPLIKRIINIKKRLLKLKGEIDHITSFLFGEATQEKGKADTPIGTGLTKQQSSTNVTDPPTGTVTSERQNKTQRDENFKSEGRRTKTGITGADIEVEIVGLYNKAVDDLQARERLREEYQPRRVGTVNAVERRQNPTIKAEFRETTDGDFFAFLIPGSHEYFVVPRLGLTIETVSYSAGALGEVFDKTRDYDPKSFYSRYRVVEPAIFACEDDQWVLLEPGKLDLGPGD